MHVAFETQTPINCRVFLGFFFFLVQILTEIGLVCGSQGKAASLSTVRHTLRTELKLYAPRRCWQEALTAPMEELAVFNRRSGVLQGSLGDARQRTPCYLACRHATAAYVNVSGEGDEKSFE